MFDLIKHILTLEATLDAAAIKSARELLFDLLLFLNNKAEFGKKKLHKQAASAKTVAEKKHYLMLLR